MRNKVYKVKEAIDTYWKKEIWDEDEDEDEIIIEGIFEKAVHNKEEVIIVLKDQEDENYKLYCFIDWKEDETNQNLKKYKYNDRMRIGSFWASPSKDNKILSLELCSVYEKENVEMMKDIQLNGTGNRTLWWESDSLYLLDNTDTGSICVVAGKDEIEELISGKENPIVFKIHNGTIYYVNNKAQLLYYNIASKKQGVIVHERAIGDFQLWDKFIFVAVQKMLKCCLYQIDLTNMNRLVITEGVMSFTIVNECYHSDKQSSGGFCCYDITDRKSICVSKNMLKIQLQYYKGKVYYVDYYRRGIYALDLKTSEENLVIEGEISEYSCYKGIIYYISKNDKNIYGISVEGKKIGKIVAREAERLNVALGSLDYIDCANNERKIILLDEIKRD